MMFGTNQASGGGGGGGGGGAGATSAGNPNLLDIKDKLYRVQVETVQRQEQLEARLKVAAAAPTEAKDRGILGAGALGSADGRGGGGFLLPPPGRVSRKQGRSETKSKLDEDNPKPAVRSTSPAGGGGGGGVAEVDFTSRMFSVQRVI